MSGLRDFQTQEKAMGKRMATKFRREIKKAVNATQKNKFSGNSAKSTAVPRFRDGLLDRITFKTPYYVYPIQHFGFEGKKNSSLSKRTKPTDVLNKATRNGDLVEELATEVSELRASLVVGNINI